jgi:hypothetical protein
MKLLSPQLSGVLRTRLGGLQSQCGLGEVHLQPCGKWYLKSVIARSLA